MIMKSVFFVFFCLFIFCSSEKLKGKRWAFLAATSNGWTNYRHQADVLHAYHLMISNGIKQENIITMIYDDIANNSANPNQGVIINKPGGPNLYPNVVKDYVGKDVTVKNFLNILSGNKEAMQGIGSGRVIESGSEDNIFVYVVDHGEVGILLFPNFEYLYAPDLINVLRKMKKEKKFLKMLMYVEACKAGSMFDNLLDDGLDVFVTTASATDELSWATYCQTLNTCLGDLYSTVWMENMDKIRDEWSASYTTLFKQYRHVRTYVNKSHVMMYGDFRLGFDKMSSFIGDEWKAHKDMLLELNVEKGATTHHTPVHSLDIPIFLLETKMKKLHNRFEKDLISLQINKIKQERSLVDDVMIQIVEKISKQNTEMYKSLVETGGSLTEDVFPCYKRVISLLNDKCFNTYKNIYVTRHFHKLVNMCSNDIDEEVISRAMDDVCNEQYRNKLDII